MSVHGLFLFIVLFATSTWAQEYVPGEVIVKLKGKSGSINSYAFLGKVSSEKEMVLKNSWGKMNMYHFGVRKGQSVVEAVNELRSDPDVEFAEPNYILSKSAETGMQQIFSAEEIQAEAAQSQATYMATGANIGVASVWTAAANSPVNTRPIVAVIDTGLDTHHYVITGTNSLWTNQDEVAGNGIDDDNNGYVDDVHGWNYVADNGAMIDDDGHGTHVTGIILSVDQNIYSTPLHTSRVQIMPLKFLDGTGTGTTSNAIRAIYYAVQNGATVLNNSWGGSGYSRALHDAVAYTYQWGAVFVAAAGNAGHNNDSIPMYPASLDVPNVISVAATTDQDNLASFSNYGLMSVELGSPGVYILSLVPGNAFGTSSGTSMAAPFVAGTAAQMKAESPTMLGYQIRSIIMNSIASYSQLSGKVSTSGRVNSATAVNFSKTASVDSTQPSYSINYLTEDRAPAAMAGGCGTVRALQAMKDGGGPRIPPFGTAVIVTALLMLPLIAQMILRKISPRNLRKHERFKINSDVRISVGDKELVGSLSSISMGGVQVNTAALLKDGGLITMTIASPDGVEKVEVAGRVVWSEANKSYGVAFDQAPQSVLSRIADWTRNLQKT